MKQLLIGVLVLSLTAITLSAADHQTGKWGDQGNGTFRNPVIAGDYSDPDMIRVADTYYLITSTFQESPGVVILQAKDLVNWSTVGGTMPDLTKIGPDFNWNRMNRYKVGIYAPSLRYHDGKFWIFVNSYSGEGFWCCTATNASGPWTVTQIKDKNGKPLRTNGWTDPCPFWDENGKAYLAASRPSGQWFGYLFEMTPDGTQLLDADVDKMNVSNVKYAYPEGGTLYSPFQSTEGNKIYKHNGYYYLVHIEFLNTGQGAGTYIMRSKHIYGTKADGTAGKPGDPGTYDILKFGNSIPGQGGYVDTPDGRWFWMGQFNKTEADGRKPHLVPVTWIDGWPVPGVEIDPATKQGKFAWEMEKPVAGQTVGLPQGSDEFDKAMLNPQWIWNHQPRVDKWSLTERPGVLRLHAFKPAGRGGFFKVGNILNQRHLRSDRTVITVRLDLAGMEDGQEGGLARFNGGKNYASLGIVRNTGGGLVLKYEEDGKAQNGPLLPEGTTAIWLRTTSNFEDLSTYDYSLDGGNTFTSFGGTYKLKGGGYRGDRIGVYTFNALGEGGNLDVDFFQYVITNK